MDVLYGDVNPSGRLPYTIAKSMDDYGVNFVSSDDQSAILSAPFTEGLFYDYRRFDQVRSLLLFSPSGVSLTGAAVQHHAALRVRLRPELHDVRVRERLRAARRADRQRVRERGGKLGAGPSRAAERRLRRRHLAAPARGRDHLRRAEHRQCRRRRGAPSLSSPHTNRAQNAPSRSRKYTCTSPPAPASRPRSSAGSQMSTLSRATPRRWRSRSRATTCPWGTS